MAQHPAPGSDDRLPEVDPHDGTGDTGDTDDTGTQHPAPRWTAPGTGGTRQHRLHLLNFADVY